MFEFAKAGVKRKNDTIAINKKVIFFIIIRYKCSRVNLGWAGVNIQIIANNVPKTFIKRKLLSNIMEIGN